MQKRLVFSFVLRKESEGMPDTERMMFQTTGPMYWKDLSQDPPVHPRNTENTRAQRNSAIHNKLTKSRLWHNPHGKLELRKTEFMTAGEACKAIFWPSTGCEEIICWYFGSSADGTLFLRLWNPTARFHNRKMSVTYLVVCCCYLLSSGCVQFCYERLLDGGDHGIADVNKVNLFEASAAPTLIFKLLNCWPVTLCADLLGHSENSCWQ